MKRNDFPFVATYKSSLSPEACVAGILSAPHEYDVDFAAKAFYEAEAVSESRLLVTFTGGQFERAHRTQYRVDFEAESEQTLITFHFLHETLNAPPATQLSWIDSFMSQKAQAERVQWERYHFDPPGVEKYYEQSHTLEKVLLAIAVSVFVILWLICMRT